MSPTRPEHAREAIAVFADECEAKYPKTVECLRRDEVALAPRFPRDENGGPRVTSRLPRWTRTPRNARNQPPSTHPLFLLIWGLNVASLPNPAVRSSLGVVRQDQGFPGLSHAYRIRLHPGEEDDAVAVLWELGTSGVHVEVESPDQIGLLAYFEDEPRDLVGRLAAIAPDASVEPTETPDVDWVARFREGFRAFDVGRFRVVPAWEATEPSEGVILVDPGQAFGTGTHESTRLCLSGLETLAARGPLGRVLDVGTGTGILAIAAGRLGASAVVASDLDVESIHEARRHRSMNRSGFDLVQADGATPFQAASFDVVVANLTGPLLENRAAELRRPLRRAGTLVIAGFLADEIESIRSAFPGPMEIVREGEWAMALSAHA